MTAREIIEARLGRPIGSIREMPRDLRRALLLLALVKQKQTETRKTRKDTDMTQEHSARPRKSETEILALCGEAVDRVDRDGRRGVTLLSMQQIEALVLYVVMTGGVDACRHARDEIEGRTARLAREVGA